ncbi:MAG: hypothetical protein CM15mP51_00030 [Porticoccaceae bacterium]|nr:MAG: hypothetical protein CM15mP51_00030 [Porticoccaceae bacterium]
MAIEKRALDYYKNDSDCPIHWEPSGYDFLSPCLSELDLKRRILSEESFLAWVKDFYLVYLKRISFGSWKG